MHATRPDRPTIVILAGAGIMLSMGMRQSFGIFMQPLTQDISIAVSDFTLAMAIQSLTWGILQPLAGALAAQVGFRPIMLAGAGIYAAGLAMMATATGVFGIVVGAGFLVEAALACTGTAVSMAVASRAVSPAIRSTVLGVVSAAGSLGSLLAAPAGQLLAGSFGWRVGVLGFLAIALALLPAAWAAGRVDGIALPRPRDGEIGEASASAAVRTALTTPSFLIMASAYSVCGMQLVFIMTHLPTYLAICGMDPMLSAEALSVIGGANVLGGLFFGWAGGRWSKPALLGAIYFSRSLMLWWFFMTPPTASSTLVFSAMIGFVWLGVGPLVAGAVAQMFGLRWQAMIQGLAFVSHQVGGFVGALGGGLLYDALGSYDLAWRFAVALGLTAGVIQITSALWRPAALATR